ncbi:hypothetical protein P0082_10785 [Candidatus Haliotispira prima]|uniref:Lipoprotein n=1 Tax=Candidatus Haliotispira prima TaxID=3034016 RepID=A0ABY8MG84_9SPIO|nr:hypothetical protein P0082_10785 [Candidatus Haliotispira prima]
MLGCAPLSDNKESPPAVKPTDISFSVTAVASSLQLEVTSVPAVTDAGALIHLATKAVPTQTEAQASKGYVSLSIDADSTRKFSLSQHYTTNFADGVTLADVLAPNTAYKLYLYMPTAIDLGTINITGGEIKGDRIEIPFTTTSLPAAGDAVWSEKFTAKKYVASLNEYHFMENQTGIVVTYFQFSAPLLIYEVSTNVSKDLNTFSVLGTYAPSGGAVASGLSYYNYGEIIGYTSDYNYSILADRSGPVMHKRVQNAYTQAGGQSITIFIPISRY